MRTPVIKTNDSADITAVAQDYAPGVAITLAREELTCRNITANVFWGDAHKPNLIKEIDAIGTSIASSKALFLGMSSSAELAESELVAGRIALHFRKPIVLLADSWDCILRPWFEPLRMSVALLFVVDREEAAAAEELYPNARIVVTGNPLWEQAIYVPYSREEARSRLDVGSNARVIAGALTKNREVNLELLRTMDNLLKTNKLNVGFVSIHPGDTNDSSMYESIIGENERLFVAQNSREMLAGTDVLLNGTSGLGIEAVALGIPVVEFKAPSIRKEENRAHPRGWKLPKKHPELVWETDSSNVLDAVRHALSHRVVWNGVVGEPPIPQATLKMADELERLLNN